MNLWRGNQTWNLSPSVQKSLLGVCLLILPSSLYHSNAAIACFRLFAKRGEIIKMCGLRTQLQLLRFRYTSIAPGSPEQGSLLLPSCSYLIQSSYHRGTMATLIHIRNYNETKLCHNTTNMPFLDNFHCSGFSVDGKIFIN